MRMPGFSAEGSLYNRSDLYKYLDNQIYGTDRRTLVPAISSAYTDPGIIGPIVGPLHMYERDRGFPWPPLQMDDILCRGPDGHNCCGYEYDKVTGQLHCLAPGADGCCHN